jgi:dienelactone hydrolase
MFLCFSNKSNKMQLSSSITALLLAGATVFVSCSNNAGNNEPFSENKSDSMTNEAPSAAAISEEAVSYTSGNHTFNGYVAYDSAATGKRPLVLVVHEWWGLTDYPRMRAKQLAQMGYVAMAVDMYGDGKIAANPEEAQTAATVLYKDPQEAKRRLDAALAKGLTLPMVDTAKTAAIGYCFGGSMVLNAAKMGSGFDGVVSFHGGLEGVPPQKEGMKAKVLVCHGGADNFVPEAQVAAFKKSMDSVGADYTFKVYPGATHAFTNPDADKKAAEFKMPIRYNGAADTASWNDMKAFFARIFP